MKFASISKYFVESKDKLVTLSNKNNESKIKHYIDGLESIDLKHLLAKNIEKYDFSIKNSKGIFPKIVKPSHPFIGSGKLIKIVNSEKELKSVLNESKKDGLIYIVEDLLTDIKLKDGYKFDCRTFIVILKNKSGFYSYFSKKGFGRKAQNKFDKNDLSINTQITNLSLIENEEEHKNYIFELDSNEMKSINEEVVKIILKEILPFKVLKKNPEYSMVILGVDSIFIDFDVEQKVKTDSKKDHIFNIYDVKNDDQFGFGKTKTKLIEINNQPAFLTDKQDTETEITDGIFKDILNIYIPNLIEDDNDKLKISTNNLEYFSTFEGANSNPDLKGLVFKDIPKEIKEYSMGRNILIEELNDNNNISQLDEITKDKKWDQSFFDWYKKSESKFFTLKYNDKIVGYIGGTKSSLSYEKLVKPTLSTVDKIFIIEIYINENYHRKGFGQLLLNHFISYGKKHDVKILYASIFEDNTQSINFFKKNGFKDLTEGKIKGKNIKMLSLTI